MITRRTKVQLAIFVVITLLGVTFVGARYARLDRLFYDDTYTVVAHFKDSGGVFDGSEVTYRGVTVGRVEKMVLTDEGVDVHLGIDNDWDEIPTESLALVGNRSAVGEQYVELQPQVDDGPYLEEDSQIDRTEIPIATSKLLADISRTTADVDRNDLRTVVRELGIAFDGTGNDLGQIIDTGNSFIKTADDNFELTRDLIRDSNTVLRTQLDSASSIRSFSRDLSLFSGTLADSDADLRRVINTGSATVNQVRRFIEENDVELASLLNNLRTVGEVVVKRLDGVEQLLVLYPYVVEGGFTVVSKDPDTGNHDAHFGLVLTEHHVCNDGYTPANRPPSDGSNPPMNTDTRCAEPASQSNARGSQHAPPRAPADYEAPVIASYDPETGEVEWGDPAANLSVRPDRGSSWQSVLLGPLGETPE